MKQPKLVFKQAEDGSWRWTSYSRNGKKLAMSSEMYSRLQRAQDGFNADTKERLALIGIVDTTKDYLMEIPSDRVNIIPFVKK